MSCMHCKAQYRLVKPCLECTMRLNDAGLCCWCGVEPRKPAINGGRWSKYCVGCQEVANKPRMEKLFNNRPIGHQATS